MKGVEVVRKGVLRRPASAAVLHPREKIVHRPEDHALYFLNAVKASRQEIRDQKIIFHHLRQR